MIITSTNVENAVPKAPYFGIKTNNEITLNTLEIMHIIKDSFSLDNAYIAVDNGAST